MPRTDSLDPQALHNIKGIDLRKNSDQNTALDAVNVRLNSRQIFVNRMMPSLYKGRSDKHMFGCEARNLSGADFDYDLSEDGSPPVISSSDTSIPKDYRKYFSFRLIGSGLAMVSNLMISESNSIKVGNTDFSFAFNKEEIGDKKTDTFLLSIVPPSGSKIIVLSPYGTYTYIVPEAS